jgi:phospholipid/cholesterol/gamma-HCH transport system substrate-binding protein
VDADNSVSETGASTPARIIAALALICAFVLAAVLLFGGSDEGNKYKFLFETGGQLVPGNQVLVAGQPIGTIDSIDLTDDSQAEVAVTLDRSLTEGTTAVIRTTSLSGVANRYISLSMGPDNADQIEEGTTIGGTDTTTAVDLDQLFNVFRAPERKALQKFITGNAVAYTGKGRLANRAYKFLNPSLSTSTKLFDELSKDSVSLQRFLVAGSKTFGAIADRSDDLSSLVSTGNEALQAVNNESESLSRALTAAPPALRQANTTFVNLRATLDDLDPLVEASYPATRNLAPFLRRFKTVSSDGRPVFADLADVVRLPGPSNDLNDALRDLPAVAESGDSAWPAAIDAMDDSQDNFAFLRPYTPDLFGFLAKFGETTAGYDANGHFARVTAAASNIFEYHGPGSVTDSSGAPRLDPIYGPYPYDPSMPPGERADQFDALDPFFEGALRRCPGGGTQVAPDGSNPFLDNGAFGINDCDASDLPPGGP